MVNEIVLVLLYGLFGWKVAALYLGTGLFIAIVAGWTIGRLKMKPHIEDWVYAAQIGEHAETNAPLDWAARIRYGLDAVREIVSKVWIFVILGIAVGAGIGPIVERTKKEGTTVVAIDGCNVACAKKALASIGVTPDVYVDVTQLGIEKGHHFNHSQEEVGKTAQAVVDALNAPACRCKQ